MTDTLRTVLTKALKPHYYSTALCGCRCGELGNPVDHQVNAVLDVITPDSDDHG